jgi:hypothetical protein
MRKLRSSITAVVEAPPPGEVPAPSQRPQDSFDFLALPEEIRMCVYHLCLVSNTEIPLDEGENSYYVINYANDDPSDKYMTRTAIQFQGVVIPPTPSITVNVETNFSYPSTTNSIVNFAPPAPNGFANKPVVPQILPLASVVQPADMSCLPTRTASSKAPFRVGTGIYIGPVRSASCSYLPPCQYVPFVGFNARLLQTCKTVHAEALPVLYNKNRFALHFPLFAKPALGKVNGRPLAHIMDLRLEVVNLGGILDVGGSNSLWSRILRQCTQVRKITLRFPDEGFWLMYDYTRAIIRVAANIADVKKGTGDPTMTVNAFLGNPSGLNMLFGSQRTVSELQSAMAVKKPSKMQVPRGVIIDLMGKMTMQEFSLLQDHTRKGWCFRRRSPENAWDVVDGAWVELEWVKIQQ